MRTAVATVHGAVSIVNAIATGMGATLGTSLTTTARLSAVPGKGIVIDTRNQSSRLITATIRSVVPKADLDRHRITVSVSSQAPTGCGLKSSSSTSTAVAMASSALFNPDLGENGVLGAGVNASIRSGVSITGAYDDVCGCYYGGFNVTRRTKPSPARGRGESASPFIVVGSKEIRRVRHGRARSNLVAVIFIPANRRRRNVRGLVRMAGALERSWRLAEEGRYWEAMTMNGLAVSPVLGPDPYLLNSLLEGGSLAASLSGNGPSVAAVVEAGGEREIKKIFSALDGRTIVTTINNTKADVHEL